MNRLLWIFQYVSALVILVFAALASWYEGSE
ncbi:putative membrane protein [Anoxybacillus amylolyticus]|uniref:Putative membrane protein n=1 Tax=Anoxybacteroides amylolyticum TaxID=294699 RepID=A0A160F6A9_9BACL|nr:putative membrane protein [Anoxybacillus amylolyticus]